MPLGSRRRAPARGDQDAAILDVARLAGSTIDVEAMLERATRLVARLVGADRASIFLLDRGGDLLLPAAIAGMGDEFARAWKLRTLRVVDEPLSREAIETRAVVVVNDARDDPRTDKGMVAFFGDRSILVAPLLASTGGGDRILGTLFANHVRTAHRFVQRDVDTMEAVAAQVAISLENARLTGVTRRLAAQLHRSFQVSGDTLAESTTESVELRTILQRLLELAVDVIDADGGRMEVRDDLARGNLVVAQATRIRDDWAAGPEGGDVTGVLVGSGRRVEPGQADVAGYLTVPVPGFSMPAAGVAPRGGGNVPSTEARPPPSMVASNRRDARSSSDGRPSGAGSQPTPEVDRLPTGAGTIPSLPIGRLVAWRADAPFGRTAVALLESIASYAGVAIEQRRLAIGVAEERSRRVAAERTRAEFVSQVTHELRTPLALIKGYVSTLRRPDLALPGETVRRFNEGIEHATDRLARLIDNLLVSSSLDAGHFVARFRSVDLGEVVRRGASELAVLDPSRPVTCDVPAAPAWVEGDPDLLVQVTQNLVGNAQKYSRPGEPVRVTVAARPGWVRVTVADTGPGIPDGAIERIFEKFFRVSLDDRERDGPDRSLAGARGPGAGSAKAPERPPGLGLGLYICRQVVSAHRGRIWAENDVPLGAGACARPSGARFIMEFPSAVRGITAPLSAGTEADDDPLAIDRGASVR